MRINSLNNIDIYNIDIIVPCFPYKQCVLPEHDFSTDRTDGPFFGRRLDGFAQAQEIRLTVREGRRRQIAGTLAQRPEFSFPNFLGCQSQNCWDVCRSKMVIKSLLLTIFCLCSICFLQLIKHHEVEKWPKSPKVRKNDLKFANWRPSKVKRNLSNLSTPTRLEFQKHFCAACGLSSMETVARDPRPVTWLTGIEEPDFEIPWTTKELEKHPTDSNWIKTCNMMQYESSPNNIKWKTNKKSAHTALAVKACLLGCTTATQNAQVTFVNIAVAISALAGGGATQRISHRAPISLVFSRFFDDFLGLEIKTVLRSNFGSFWCLCGPNFGSFWWLSGAIPTRVGSKNFAPGPCIAGVFAFFRRFFEVGDQDDLEIELWVILVPLWIEFWVILVALWCKSYSGPLEEFCIRPLYRWCFCVFSTIFWGWRSRRYWNRILGHFGASVDRILGHFDGSLVQFLFLRGC